MNTYETRSYQTHAGEQHKRRTLEADLIKLTIAIIAELLIFFFWLDAPTRERYEVLVHVALPICIVLPILNYRYLILVPFIAFLPDIARAFGISISHSLALLPIVFLAAFVPFINRPRIALVAGYAVFAIVASHLIIDSRKYAITENVAGYPWSDLVLYTVIMTVLGFLLVQVLRFGDGHGPGDRSLSNRTPLSGESPVVHHPDDNVSSLNSRPRRSRRIEITEPEGTAEISEVNKAKDPSSSADDKLQFDYDGFVVGDVTSKKALRSKIRGKKGS